MVTEKKVDYTSNHSIVFDENQNELLNSSNTPHNGYGRQPLSFTNPIKLVESTDTSAYFQSTPTSPDQVNPNKTRRYVTNKL